MKSNIFFVSIEIFHRSPSTPPDRYRYNRYIPTYISQNEQVCLQARFAIIGHCYVRCWRWVGGKILARPFRGKRFVHSLPLHCHQSTAFHCLRRPLTTGARPPARCNNQRSSSISSPAFAHLSTVHHRCQGARALSAVGTLLPAKSASLRTWDRNVLSLINRLGKCHRFCNVTMRSILIYIIHLRFSTARS